MKTNLVKSILWTLSFFITGLILISSHAYFSYNESKEILEETIKQELLNKGNLISLSLNYENLETLTNSIENKEDLPLYQETINPLIKAHEKVNELKTSIKYVYTAHKKNDVIYFGLDTAPKVDSDKDGKIDHAFLNEKYETPPKEMIDAFNTGKPQISEKPYTDAWGTFIGAFIPLINPKTGVVFGILGLDLTLTQYLRDLDILLGRTKIYFLFAVSFLLASSLILFFFLERSRELKNQFIKQKEQELFLIQQEKLAEVGLMSSSIAHEINNPLSVIYMHLFNINRFIDNKEKVLNSVKKIEEAYSKIQKTLSSMKNFIRKDDSVKQESSMSKIIEETVAFLNVKMKYFKVEINSNSNTPFQCFEIQVSQVLINLLSNAMDAMENQEEKNIYIDSYEENNKIIVKVKNSGAPIPEDVLKKIESGFYSTKSKGKGSGMGLMISKKILENHDGKLNYVVEDNMPCFVFEIPITNIQEEAA